MLSSSSLLLRESEPPTASSLRAEAALEAARWQSSRWQYVLRPFSAASVVSLRCPLPTRLHYAGAMPAVKLHSLLRQHFAAGTFAHTFGCMDAVQVSNHIQPARTAGRTATDGHMNEVAHSRCTDRLCSLSSLSPLPLCLAAQVEAMARHLSTVYVSGWQCSSTASVTNEPGPDLADVRRTDITQP